MSAFAITLGDIQAAAVKLDGQLGQRRGLEQQQEEETVAHRFIGHSQHCLKRILVARRIL